MKATDDKLKNRVTILISKIHGRIWYVKDQAEGTEVVRQIYKTKGKLLLENDLNMPLCLYCEEVTAIYMPGDLSDTTVDKFMEDK